MEHSPTLVETGVTWEYMLMEAFLFTVPVKVAIGIKTGKFLYSPSKKENYENQNESELITLTTSAKGDRPVVS